MAQNDFEKTVKAMVGEKGSRQVDWNALSQLVSGKEGRALLQSLAGSGGDALKRSAEGALKGDKDAASRLVAGLLSTREGADLVQKMMKLMK